jgi:hypothetical protein
MCERGQVRSSAVDRRRDHDRDEFRHICVVVKVTLSGASDETVTVRYATVDGNDPAAKPD